MVAAAASMIEQNAPYEDVLRCAVAAGTASVMTPGTNLFYKENFIEIYRKIQVERLRWAFDSGYDNSCRRINVEKQGLKQAENLFQAL